MKEGESKKILVVEDSLVNRQIVCEMLKKRGIETKEAENGVEAIQKILKGDFDLVLMDVEMPVMDGYEAIDLIRNKMDTRELPIILFTASEKNDVDKIKKLKINDVLKKPITAEGLDDILYKWLDIKSRKTTLNKEKSTIEEFKNFHKFRHIDVEEGMKYSGCILNIYINALLNFRETFHEVYKNFGVEMLKRKKVTLKTFHTLKSNSAAIGAKRLSELAGQIEAGAMAEDNMFLKPIIEEVVVIMEDVLADILRMKYQLNIESGEIDKELIIKKIENLIVLLDKEPAGIGIIFKEISGMLTGRSDLFISMEIIKVQIEREYYNDVISNLEVLKNKI